MNFLQEFLRIYLELISPVEKKYFGILIFLVFSTYVNIEESI